MFALVDLRSLASSGQRLRNPVTQAHAAGGGSSAAPLEEFKEQVAGFFQEWYHGFVKPQQRRIVMEAMSEQACGWDIEEGFVCAC